MRVHVIGVSSSSCRVGTLSLPLLGHRNHSFALPHLDEDLVERIVACLRHDGEHEDKEEEEEADEDDERVRFTASFTDSNARRRRTSRSSCSIY